MAYYYIPSLFLPPSLLLFLPPSLLPSLVSCVYDRYTRLLLRMRELNRVEGQDIHFYEYHYQKKTVYPAEY